MNTKREAHHRIWIYKALSILFVASLLLNPSFVNAQSKDELQDQIGEKNKELLQLNSQIQQTQGEINVLQGQGQTLKKAIKAIDAQISQVSYGIKSSKVGIEKLSLEIQSLGIEIDEVGEEIDIKEVAIAQILREVQQRDRDGLLEIMLKHETLADSVFEIQSLQDLQSNLSVNVVQLSNLQDILTGTFELTEVKKVDLVDENVTLKSRKNILDDQQDEKDNLLSQTKNKENVYQQQLSVLRQEQQKILDELSSIEDELNARLDRGSIPSKRPGYLSWPFKLTSEGGPGRITQVYGETAYSTQYYKGKPHNAIDIAAPLGTKVYASADGVVARSDYNGLYYQYGRYILIDHGNNLSTMYAHLSGSIVSSGQSVKKGQLIGYVGNTGFSFGSHIHFGVYVTPPIGWVQTTNRDTGGLFALPPASGLVPISATLNPGDYL